eukprot:13393211-Ditylum_brightwellii.AAC.1
MDIVQFGMKSMLIQFRGRYYVYKGAAKGKELSNDYVTLAIGAYESAFLFNIIASYVFEETGKRNEREIQEWLRKYQSL